MLAIFSYNPIKYIAIHHNLKYTMTGPWSMWQCDLLYVLLQKSFTSLYLSN